MCQFLQLPCTYIQDDFFILGNAVATAIDGITGMPVLAMNEMKTEDLKKIHLDCTRTQYISLHTV